MLLSKRVPFFVRGPEFVGHFHSDARYYLGTGQRNKSNYGYPEIGKPSRWFCKEVC
jgi:hypothetical protein